MFFVGLTFILCSIILIQIGLDTVFTSVGAVGCVLWYTLLIIWYVLSQGEIADIEKRITKLEKKMNDMNDNSDDKEEGN